MKQECWEFMDCGRQPGGDKVHELGHCPASTSASFHGVHSGINAGRSCWMVSKTLCGGVRQGDYKSKLKMCKMCKFYNIVLIQETMQGTFVFARDFLKKIN
jgi:eukaryotic-like serine/threonine-protein kinase